MNRDLMLSLVRKAIKVDRGGPESRVGILLAVEDDHLILFTKDDGVVYYKLQHVKSVSLDTKGNQELEIPEDLEHFTGTDFKTVISNYRHSWVKVNRGGPEALEGILDEVSDEYVTIFSKHEVIHLAMFHIRNISSGIKEKEEEKEENQEKQEKQEKQNNNGRSGNRRRK